MQPSHFFPPQAAQMAAGPGTGPGYMPMQQAYDGSVESSRVVAYQGQPATAGHPKGRGSSRKEPSDAFPEEEESEDQEPSLVTRLMTEGDPYNSRFQMTTAAVIMVCTVSMAIETDCWPDAAGWWFFDTLILIYFCVELAIRMQYQKLQFFSCWNNKEWAWNYFDSSIVLICIVDQWLEPLLLMITGQESKGGFGVLRIFRVFRILRTLRVLRIFRACTELNTLAVGLLDSIGTVFWIALLMLMFMLIFAIILTDVAGNQAKLAKEKGDLFYDKKEDIELYWGSVGKSLVTLFQFLTLDDWTNISRQVFEEMPSMWFVFFLYIFLMGFAMLSLLTGVVAEHMTAVSTETKQEQKQDDDQELDKFLDVKLQKLMQIAIDRSPDGGGTSRSGKPVSVDDGMTHEAFEIFLSEKEVKDKLKEFDASLAKHEAKEFWDCLDRDGDGRLSLDELKRGMLRLRGELEPKDMLRIRYAAERVVKRLRGGQGEAATTRKLEEISGNLNSVEVRLKTMRDQLTRFMDHIRNDREGAAKFNSAGKREGCQACT